MFIINIEGYTEKEKIQILIHYLFPKYLDSLCIDKQNILINEEIAGYMIRKCTKPNKGIRDIERLVKDVLTKLTFIVQHGNIQVSFNGTKPLNYPVQLTTELVDMLTKNMYDNNPMYMSMYL